MGLRHKPLLALAASCALIAVAAAAGALGCGGTSAHSSGSEGSSGCRQVQKPKSKPVSYRPPKQTVKEGEKLSARVKTSCGSFRIALDTAQDPTVVNSFVFLANKGFYDGLAFDQAAPGAFLSGGKPSGPNGGPGYSVKGQEPPALHYTKGVVAMTPTAGAPPGSAESGFFIVVAPYLDFSPTSPLLGRIEKGFDVVERISKLGPAATKPPSLGYAGVIGSLKQTVLIEGISIERG